VWRYLRPDADSADKLGHAAGVVRGAHLTSLHSLRCGRQRTFPLRAGRCQGPASSAGARRPARGSTTPSKRSGSFVERAGAPPLRKTSAPPHPTPTRSTLISIPLCLLKLRHTRSGRKSLSGVKPARCRRATLGRPCLADYRTQIDCMESNRQPERGSRTRGAVTRAVLTVAVLLSGCYGRGCECGYRGRGYGNHGGHDRRWDRDHDRR
jgi:hypothetical protein